MKTSKHLNGKETLWMCWFVFRNKPLVAFSKVPGGMRLLLHANKTVTISSLNLHPKIFNKTVTRSSLNLHSRISVTMYHVNNEPCISSIRCEITIHQLHKIQKTSLNVAVSEPCSHPSCAGLPICSLCALQSLQVRLSIEDEEGVPEWTYFKHCLLYQLNQPQNNQDPRSLVHEFLSSAAPQVPFKIP